jgi:hypothetical protein
MKMIFWSGKQNCKFVCESSVVVFVFREQALTVLQESIRIAQESNDHVCLAHGLKLMYKLTQDGDSQAKHILERFCARAAELKLPVRQTSPQGF